MADRDRSDYDTDQGQMRYRDQEGRRTQYRPGERGNGGSYGGQEYYEGSRGGRWDEESAWDAREYSGGEGARGWQRQLPGGMWQRQQDWELQGGPSSGRWEEAERPRGGYTQSDRWEREWPRRESSYWGEYDPYARSRRGAPYGMEYPENPERSSPGGYGQMYRQGEMGGPEGGMYNYGERGQGMSGPYRGRGPKTYQRSDDRICEDVCERLTRHPEIDAEDIDVKVEKGVVILNGSVMDRYQKRMTEDAIEGVSGIRDITNQLRVGMGEGRQGQMATAGSQYRSSATGASTPSRSGASRSTSRSSGTSSRSTASRSGTSGRSTTSRSSTTPSRSGTSTTRGTSASRSGTSRSGSTGSRTGASSSRTNPRSSTARSSTSRTPSSGMGSTSSRTPGMQGSSNPPSSGTTGAGESRDPFRTSSPQSS